MKWNKKINVSKIQNSRGERNVMCGEVKKKKNSLFKFTQTDILIWRVYWSFDFHSIFSIFFSSFLSVRFTSVIIRCWFLFHVVALVLTMFMPKTSNNSLYFNATAIQKELISWFEKKKKIKSMNYTNFWFVIFFYFISYYNFEKAKNQLEKTCVWFWFFWP